MIAAGPALAEILDSVTGFGVVEGMKSTIVMVCCIRKSGGGASIVSLKEVEHGVSGLQQAHELLLVL